MISVLSLWFGIHTSYLDNWILAVRVPPYLGRKPGAKRNLGPLPMVSGKALRVNTS